MRIEICGGIAAGKTTLTMLMHNAGVSAVFENFKNNPFWEAFYTNPGKYIFETEITFLLQHYHDIKKILEDKTVFICDFSMYIDLAYAQMGLNDIRLKIFKRVQEEIFSEIHTPDVVINLVCDPHIQYERIIKRGRTVESSITVDFLELLDNKVYENLTSLTNTKIITIDSGKEDFATNEDVKTRLITEIKSIL